MAYCLIEFGMAIASVLVVTVAAKLHEGEYADELHETF
jgi:hypothetical protein